MRRSLLLTLRSLLARWSLLAGLLLLLHSLLLLLMSLLHLLRLLLMLLLYLLSSRVIRPLAFHPLMFLVLFLL